MELSPREKEFFDMLCYLMGDEMLTLGYCGTFEDIVKKYETTPKQITDVRNKNANE